MYYTKTVWLQQSFCLTVHIIKRVSQALITLSRFITLHSLSRGPSWYSRHTISYCTHVRKNRIPAIFYLDCILAHRALYEQRSFLQAHYQQQSRTLALLSDNLISRVELKTSIYGTTDDSSEAIRRLLKNILFSCCTGYTIRTTNSFLPSLIRELLSA